MITIIIATKNRLKKLRSCLASIVSTNTDLPYEIIVCDQSDDSHRPFSKIITRHIKHIQVKKGGKSFAINQGISKALGEIISFTDDDCIVSKNWLNEIKKVFHENPNIACVTGNTKPYKNIPSWACPPLISTKLRTFSEPGYHPKIGFGNNFAIRRSVLKSIGPFKTWLGPGSVSTNCEDGEMILRLLTRGHNVIHNPKIIVCHNKTLNKSELKKQYLSYICGEMACYGYYSLSGYTFAQKVICDNFINSFYDIRRMFGDILKRKIVKTDEWIYSIKKLGTGMRGFLIGLFFYIKEVKLRIRDKTDLMN